MMRKRAVSITKRRARMRVPQIAVARDAHPDRGVDRGPGGFAIEREGTLLALALAMVRPILLVVLGLVFLPRAARAEPLGTISGRVLDATYGLPLAGALVHVSGPDGSVKALSSTASGRYEILVKPGAYRVLFAYASSHSVGEVTVEPGATRHLDARVDATRGEVIVIHEQLPPKRLPVALNFPRWKTPPYSERAITADAWTRAWLLLDIDERGRVTRFKWLKRPGYDLEDIARAEIFKVTFSPALDADGKPTRLYAMWKFEWPAQSWQTLVPRNTRSRQPWAIEIEYIPCRGQQGWNLDSLYKGDRDCSTPDPSKARAEAWVLPPSR